MRLRTASLGLKLNLALLLFFLVLGGATLAIVAYGFNRTQDNATERSHEALEELGRLALSSVAAGKAEAGGVQFESASEIGQRAARFMQSFRRTEAAISFDTTGLEQTEDGLYYDPDPARTSDFIALPYVQLDDPRVADEIAYAAALDPLLDSIYEGFEDEVGGRNFDPHAIGFVGAHGTGRYYPPRGIHDTIPADLDISGLLERAGPAGNPDRRTTWTRPYEDAIGQGLVVTAESPVYEGDTYRGVIQVDLHINSFVSQIDSIRPTPGGFAFYVDVEGDLMHSAAHARLSDEVTHNPDLAAILVAMAASGPGVVVETVDLGGEEFFVAYAPMPSLGGSLGVAGPVTEITAEAAAITAGIGEEGSRTLRATLAAMGALFLFGLVGAGYLNRRMLVTPIAELLRAARSVASGSLDTAIPVRTTDELGALAEGFNTMVDDLRQRDAALAAEAQQREEAQSELGALFAAMEDVVIVLDRDGQCLRVAPTHPPDPRYVPGHDMVGRRLPDVMPAELAEVFLERIATALHSGETQAFQYPVAGESGDRWFAAAITPMGAERVVYVGRDVTEHVAAEQLLEQRVEERTRELQVLLDVSRNVASTLEMQDLATRILDQLRAIIPFDGAAVLLLEGDGVRILETWDAAAGSGHDPVPRWVAGPPGGAGTLSIQQRAPVVVTDVATEPDLLAWTRQVPGGAAAARSWLSVPLIAQERALGVLNLWSLAPGSFDSRKADLAMAVANQAAVAIENARLYEQASSVAALEERQRLARELHDSVSQALYGIALGAQTARQLLDEDARAVAPVDYVLSLAEAGLAEMRALIFELRPESLESEGLVAALEKQAAAARARYSLDLVATLPAEPDAPLVVKEALYRIAQEALHNVVKHARPGHVHLRLDARPSELRLEVADDGVGFEVDGEFPGHLGLRSMRERAEAVRGSLTIESQPGLGSRVLAVVPVS